MSDVRAESATASATEGPTATESASASNGTRALEVDGLTVSYGGIAAVKGISLYVEPGEIVAILGANGAGKTSTMKALVRLVKSGGAVKIFGRHVAA